jgi:glycerol-3-phosphate dehydrogenase subunit B
MSDILVIGAGPAGLLAAWIARQRGARVRVLAAGIGTTHIAAGWIGLLDADGDLPAALGHWAAAHPRHPYSLALGQSPGLAGLEALWGGIVALREVADQSGLSYEGDLSGNYRLPTALGASAAAALAPASFVAGDLRRPEPMLIAGPQGWRDFYPQLCAENLARQGVAARGLSFDLPEMRAASQFDLTSTGLARLFERAEVRAHIADQLRPRLEGAARVGFPAVIGLERAAEAWRDLQERLGVPVFEIPTLPPSVPGMRLYQACKAALARAGVQILLDMTVTRGVTANGRAIGVIAPDVVRERTYRGDAIILATGGLYGGGIASDQRGELRETIFGLPLYTPPRDASQERAGVGDWFQPVFLSEQEHPIHQVGVRANSQLQPVDESGRVVLANVYIAGRLLAGYAPLAEGSTEGVWLATAYRAAQEAGAL